MKTKTIPAWIVLGIIALVAGLLLGLTNDLTAPKIAEAAAEAAESTRKSLLSQAEEFEAVKLDKKAKLDNCYRGTKDGETVGYVTQITVKGYGGEIEIMAGFDTEGVCTGISVGGANFSETPGLGANSKNESFTNQFKGQTAPIVLGESVDAITAATITSTAVVNGVNTMADYVATLS